MSVHKMMLLFFVKPEQSAGQTGRLGRAFQSYSIVKLREAPQERFVEGQGFPHPDRVFFLTIEYFLPENRPIRSDLLRHFSTDMECDRCGRFAHWQRIHRADLS